MPSKHVLANREVNSRHTYDVTIWLSRTTDNSNILSGPVKFEIRRVDCIYKQLIPVLRKREDGGKQERWNETTLWT